jgi:urease accessory protein
MLTLHTRLSITEAKAALQEASLLSGVPTLVLGYDQREKCRQRAVLSSGEEVAILTQRGTVLRDGDYLQGSDGELTRIVQVLAAAEPGYRVQCANEHDLLRCAFHLGNRHTQVQLGQDPGGSFLRIRQDPVLKDMLQGLGAVVLEELAAFEPESGAYSGGGHHHHGDEHAHGHAHPLAPIPLRQKIHRPSDLKV